MKYTLLFIIVFVWANLQSQPWYSRMYNVTGGHEAAKAMAVSGDSVFIRAGYVCDTTLCTILGVFSHSENDFVDLRQYEGIQLGNKNVMQNDSFIFISSEERILNKNISVSKFDKHSLDQLAYRNLRVDSSQYFSYVIGPCIKYFNQLVVGANALDSLNFIGYWGWYNYQERGLLFVLDDELNTDTILIIPPSSGAFMKMEDMAIGPDSILYISFYEKYLKQGNPNLFLEIRKVIFGYNRKWQKVFQWIGPDFDVPESLTCLAIDEDSIIYFNYKHDFKSYIAALNPDASLKWECLLVANSGAYLYAISRIIKSKNGDIIGTGTISSAVDELGESGFIFRIDQNGILLWKRAIRINKGMDLTLPPEFPYRANLEDIVELPNGDLLATGWVQRYVGYDAPGGPNNEDIWIVRTNEDGCLWPGCPFIQDVVSRDQYIRLVTSLNEWVVDVVTPPSPTVINRFSFDPDSILINDKYYYELIYIPDIQGQWQETGRLMRQDNGRIYELDKSDSTDILLYDFDLQTGDTLATFQGQTNSIKRIINVGTIKLWDEIPRKSMTIECSSDSIASDTTVWIEGMGDVDRLFWSKTYCSEGDTNVEIRNIRCFLVNKQAIFSRPDLEDCFLTSVDGLNTESIEVYPNPVFETLHFKLEGNPGITKVVLYNSIGQIVLSSNELSSDHALDVSLFPPGVYYGLIRFHVGNSKTFKVLIL